MLGIGIGILWLGYTGLTTGRAYAKGIPVTFSDMVRPKYRTATIAMLKQGGAAGTTQGAGSPSPAKSIIGNVGSSNPLSEAAGIVTFSPLLTLVNGLKSLGNDLKKIIP